MCSSAASSRCTRMRSAGYSQRTAVICRSARPAARCRSSRRVNSNKTAPMTGISPNASGAPGRCGAWAQLKLAEAATRPQTARRGASPDSARAARLVSSTAQTPAAPSKARNSRYGQGPVKPMFSRANPVRPWAEIPAATAANPPSSRYWATDATVSRACARPLTGCLQRRHPRHDARQPGALAGPPRYPCARPVTRRCTSAAGLVPGWRAGLCSRPAVSVLSSRNPGIGD